MATTFTLNSKSYDGRYLKLTCSQTKNIANNTSTIDWTLESVGGDVNYYYTGPTTLTIDGQQAYYAARTGEHVFPCAKGSKSGTITVSHASDGSKSVSVSLKTAIYTKTVSTTSDTWTLDSNPRGASITMATNFNDEQNPTISFINPAGNTVDKLEVCISADGTNPLVGYKTITDKTGIAYTFSLTDAERKALRQSITKGSSRTITYILRTTMGSNVFTNKAERTLTLINHEPVVSINVKDNNPTTTALTGNSSRFIKGHSTASYTITATARKEATIASYFCNGDPVSANDAILNIATNSIEYGAIDSRGIETRATQPITLIDYVPVSCRQKVEIELSGETTAAITVKVEGTCFNGSFGNKANELFLNVYYREAGATDWQGVIQITEAHTPTYNGNSFTLTAPLPVSFDYSKAWTIETVAEDALTVAHSGEYTVNLVPVFDWSDSDFNFNVPIKIKNQEIKDFVVEQGTSGIWTYRLWNSGIAECWGTIAPAAHSITTAWGAIYTKDNAIARQSYPFQFVSDPVVSMTLHNPTGNCWAFTGTPGGISQSPAFGLARGTSGSVTVGARIMAIGRWK